MQVTNGKVISNGSRNIVLGIAMPGLKESLKLKESDFDKDISIPDYVEVTADVENFELDMTMTVVTGMSEFSSDTSFGYAEWKNGAIYRRRIDTAKRSSGIYRRSKTIGGRHCHPKRRNGPSS